MRIRCVSILICLQIVLAIATVGQGFCETVESDSEIDDRIEKMSVRLDELSGELLNTELTPNERAALLYEKSKIMLTQMWPMALRSGTEGLLKAIQLDPSKQEYISFLKEVYEHLWKDKDLSGDDEITTGLKELRGRVVAMLEK